MKLSFTYLSLALSLLILTISFAQSQEFLIQKYPVENRLPDYRANDIAQDSLGRIWVAMKTGIAVYDEVEWEDLFE
jgi:ligand-binding sensor domain-containing protein